MRAGDKAALHEKLDKESDITQSVKEGMHIIFICIKKKYMGKPPMRLMYTYRTDNRSKMIFASTPRIVGKCEVKLHYVLRER